MNITKKEFIQQLVDKHHYTKKSAATLVDDFCDTIVENLRNGNAVSLRGFGCFDILERKARKCPHPIKGHECVIPAHWVPKFYAGDTMRRAVKTWEDNDKRGLT